MACGKCLNKHEAIKNNHIECENILTEDYHEYYAVHAASYYGHLDMLKHLHKKGYNLDRLDNNKRGYNLIQCIALIYSGYTSDHIQCVEYAINNVADPIKFIDYNVCGGQSAIEMVAYAYYRYDTSNALTFMALLINYGADTSKLRSIISDENKYNKVKEIIDDYNSISFIKGCYE